MTKRRSHRSEPTNSRRDYQRKDYRVQEPEPQSTKGKIQTTVLIKPVNESQRKMVQSIRNNTITLVSGDAGVGKGLVSIYEAIRLINSQESPIKKLVYVRSNVGMKDSESIGALPGPQPLDAKVLTPEGWVTMGSLKVGDYIIAGDGSPSKILGIYPKGEKEIYKVTTSDGTSTECCEDHLWYTETLENRKRNKKGSVKSTREINETLLANNLREGRSNLNHFLPRNGVVNYKDSVLPLAPYTLGSLLGDGYMGVYSTPVLSNIDLEIITRVEEEVSLLGCIVKKQGDSINYQITNKDYFSRRPARPLQLTYSNEGNRREVFSSVDEALLVCSGVSKSGLKSRCSNTSTIGGVNYSFLETSVQSTNPLKEILHKLDLVGCTAVNKFIPSVYKYSSVQNRLDLLRGLMDTDGTVKDSGEASFCTVSKTLAEDVIEVVRSLGGRASLCSRDRVGRMTSIKSQEVIHKEVSYEFTVSLPEEFNPFFLSRKACRYSQKYIHSPRFKSIEKIGFKECQCILIDHPDHLYITDEFIVTHNTLDEKMMVLAYPVLDNLIEFMEEGKAKFLLEKEVIECLPINFVRGRSFANSLVILDEAQCCTVHMLRAILTRVSHGTKLVLLGDLKQIDLEAGKSGFAKVLNALANCPDVGVVRFNKNEVVRHPIIAPVLDRLEGLD